MNALCFERDCRAQEWSGGRCRAHAHQSVPPRRDVVSLLTRVLEGQPHLNGASCIHRPDLFDAAAADLLDHRAIATAAQVCERCPATERCGVFAQHDGATGVFAGQVFVAGRAFTVEQWIMA